MHHCVTYLSDCPTEGASAGKVCQREAVSVPGEQVSERTSNKGATSSKTG